MEKKEEVVQQKSTLLQDVKQKFQHEIQILNAQIRRLNCLRSISQISEKPGILLKDIIQSITNLIPEGMRNPQNVFVRIWLNERKFKTDNFKKTNIGYRTTFQVNGKRVGIIEVYLLNNSDEPSFMEEEKELIDDIAAQLSRSIEQRLAVTALQKSEEKYRTTFEQAAIGITHISPEGRFVLVNPTFCDFLNYSASDFLTLELHEIIHPDDLEENLNSMQQVLNEEAGNYSNICRYIKKNGEGISLFQTVSLVKNNSGYADYFVNCVHELWDQQRQIAEQENERKEEIDEKIYTTEITGEGERILIVEDEEVVCEFVTKMLQRKGYVVYTATNAKEALETFEKENGDFELIFTDVVLPDKTGIKLIDDLHALKPGFHVLFSSGYGNHKSEWPDIFEKGFRFIEKPYSFPDLLRTIKEVIQAH